MNGFCDQLFKRRIIQNPVGNVKQKFCFKLIYDTIDPYRLIYQNRKRLTMFCTNCGNKLPDDAIFCPFCGEKVQFEAAPAVQVSAAEEPPVAAAEPPKKKKTGLIAAIIAVVIIAVGVYKTGQDKDADRGYHRSQRL